MQRIGITERGDASESFLWVDKMDSVSMAVLITKDITEKFITEVLKFKNKVIVHATITGWGGSIIEPNSPRVEYSYNRLKSLIIRGFPSEQIVLRIDPIFTTKEGLYRVDKVLDMFKELGVRRVRFSFLDKYKHVVDRFSKEGVKDLLPAYSYNIPFNFDINKTFKLLEKYKDYYTFEVCSEDIPYNENILQVGCISKIDLDILNKKIELEGSSNQRTNCLCPSNKLELLNTRHPCKHKCLYCYWRD